MADRRAPVKYPTRTNIIQRQIPSQPWYLSSFITYVFFYGIYNLKLAFLWEG